MAKLKLQGHASGTGVFTLSPPNSSTDRTITLPDDSGALLTDGSTIGTSQIAADAVTSAKIADDSIDSEHIVDGSIDTAHIGDDQVTAAKLANSINTDIATGVTANTTANAALPKAGGTMTGDLILGDNVKVEVGSLSGGDCEIYHDGSHTRIQNNTGNLNIRTGVLSVTNVADNETILQGNADGSVDLYHDNSKALSTHGNGANVHGSAAYSQLTFKDSAGNVDGYAHGESGAIGFKDGDADWSFKCNNGADFNWYVNGNEKMRLESDADLHVDGDVIAYSTTISDATLKYDINPVEFALDKINQLKGVSYKYKHNDRESAGLLAQDVEKVMPSAVNTKKLPLATGDDKEYKTLHYDSMTAILVEAIKELTAKVKKLEGK